MYSLDQLMVLDIETVPQQASFAQLDSLWQKLWTQKAARLDPNQSPEELYKRAGIYAEFGKIVCIGMGLFHREDDEWHIKVKTLAGHDEVQLLLRFSDLLTAFEAHAPCLLAAHNGKEFDFPYICRRMMVHGLPLPEVLDIGGKKPWEVPHIDTMNLWKFGDHKAFTSLELLATTLGIDTPKQNLDGSKVAQVYWKQEDLDRIASYCRKDVVTTAQVLSVFKLGRVIPREYVLEVEDNSTA